jgi:CubicO group peptidase (beta-lactamase class C family)
MKAGPWRILLSIAGWSLLGGSLALGQQVEASGVSAIVERLQPEIEQTLVQGRIPSCTVALVSAKEILWVGAFGQSNLWAGTPATTETVYLLGSTFKTMSTAALLQHMELGKFRLDDPVHRHLGTLKIQDEDPEQPVTFRHLLSHTSGLPGAFGPHRVWGSTVPDPLPVYLRRELRVEGPPETKVRYSNLAYTLTAYLLEQFSGASFQACIQRTIFDAAEMQNTAFEPTPAMEERLAVPYIVDSRSGELVAAERLKADVWPAGIVYGTIRDQAHWLMTMLNGGRFGNNQILQESTVEQLLERQYDQFGGPMVAGWGNDSAGFGLTWWVCQRQGERHFAHSGSVPGYTAFLEGNYDRGIGFAILTNGPSAHAHLVQLAESALGKLREIELQAGR